MSETQYFTISCLALAEELDTAVVQAVALNPDRMAVLLTQAVEIASLIRCLGPFIVGQPLFDVRARIRALARDQVDALKMNFLLEPISGNECALNQ